jgi:hypothetical protein
MTDGEIETADDLEYDPRAFEMSLAPAIVGEVLDDDSISKVSLADVQLHESGALRWKEWSGAAGLLPESRWSEVRYLKTTRAGSDSRQTIRICAGDWYRLPPDVNAVIDPYPSGGESE